MVPKILRTIIPLILSNFDFPSFANLNVSINLTANKIRLILKITSNTLFILKTMVLKL